MKLNKTLVIVTHPDIENSVVNKRWAEEAHRNLDFVTVHSIYDRYPDMKIDVGAEQKLLLNYDVIVFQFPLYWFSTPPLLKMWFDEVLTQEFSYGRQENERNLSGKRIGIAVSAGIKEIDFTKDGRYEGTLTDYLRPLISTMDYISAKPLPVFAYYGVEFGISNDDLESSVEQYLQFLKHSAVA
ncbi:NAD(P)H2 dehydrogenase [Janthinobacterium sp. Marseille]|uniref:NAD(P)H-dependent oxidoreductase n=1 Tax=Herminiimonas aquatilis TaxID=345342 RepID=A0ABW2J5W0_9BURK|nr:NAD(P)H-dependent oxidoreductase [Janthinobacterium sp. Marseille]ABR91514.1 NAD(P)H2 dehydrogenase [Janthinobacterium sp. Marseille]